MSPAEAAIAIIVEMLCGAAGAFAARWRWSGLGLTRIATILADMVGGLALTFVAARIPGIGSLVGHVENAADSVMRGTGGLTPAVLVGVGVAGLLGGAILTAIVGFVAKADGTGK